MLGESALGGRLRSPEARRDAVGALDTRSKGRASTKRQTMPVGTLYALSLIGLRRGVREHPAKSGVYLLAPNLAYSLASHGKGTRVKRIEQR